MGRVVALNRAKTRAEAKASASVRFVNAQPVELVPVAALDMAVSCAVWLL
jgi:hypothetical protein